MKKIFAIYSSLVIFAASCLGAIAQTSDFELLTKIPSNDGFDFRCQDMIHVVNHLRHLGKDKALLVLSNYVQEIGPVTPENVVLICRVLFVNTNSWTIKVAGEPVTQVDSAASVKFPLFPIVISQGIPFQVVDGYLSNGFYGGPPAPTACIEYCRGLQMISADLTNTNFESAAQSLIGSKDFQELYKDPNDKAWITSMILRQAGSTNEIIKLPNGSRRIVPLKP